MTALFVSNQTDMTEIQKNHVGYMFFKWQPNLTALREEILTPWICISCVQNSSETEFVQCAYSAESTISPILTRILGSDPSLNKCSQSMEELSINHAVNHNSSKAQNNLLKSMSVRLNSCCFLALKPFTDLCRVQGVDWQATMREAVFRSCLFVCA